MFVKLPAKFLNNKIMSNCVILTIGDELLIGQVIDTNSAWIGSELSKIGIPVLRRVAVSDRADEIVKALDDSLQFADIILITGGLGPTKDDITKHTLSQYFNSRLVTNADVLNDVTSFFKKVNRPMIESNYKQAEVPEHCIPIRNKLGTAPGMLFEKNQKVIVSMPGVPFEMKEMMTSYVLPELKKRFSREHIEHITIMTAGVGESFLAEKIRHWEQALPHHIKLAYLPNLSQVRLRLSGRGSDLQVLKKEMQQAVEHLIPIIDQNIFSLLDEGIEVAVGKLLQTKHMTVATAESCTGGYMAHKITSVPGSSDWYRGSIVAYQNDLKEQLLQVNHETLLQHGAVSEETVKQMANQVRLLLKSDYGIAISGIAGPDGGSDEKPLGTVWVAIADHDTVYTKKFLFTRSRLQNIEMSALNALFMLYRVIKGNFTQS